MNVNSNFFEAKRSPWAMPALRLAGACLLYGGAVLGTAMAQDLPNAPDTRPAVGTTPEAQKPASSPWSVGVGSFTQWQPYTGLSAQTKVLPLLGYDNGLVKWQGPTLDVRLPVSAPSSAYALSARAYYSGDGYAADDAPVFEGMAKRQSKYEGTSHLLVTASSAKIGVCEKVNLQPLQGEVP